MTTRQVTRIKVEVEFVLPVGKRPPWGVEEVKTLLGEASLEDGKARFAALAVRLISKETTYL